MAKNAVTDWDTTAANNTDVGGIGIQGSSAITSGDDALREIMKQIATVRAKGANLVAASTLTLGTDGSSFTITGNTAITAISTLPAGAIVMFNTTGTPTWTHSSPGLVLPGGQNIVAADRDVSIWQSSGSGNWRCLSYFRASGRSLKTHAGHLFGLTLSNNGSDATNDIDIAAGEAAAEDTDPVLIVLAAALTKRLDAAWAVGTNQGGLDTGAIADTTYHVWLIRRPDTGVVDALFSTSASAPTMPTNYTQKRRIGSILRASSAIRAFSQFGDEFVLSAAVLNHSQNAPGTGAVTYALSVPNGIKVLAKVNAVLRNNSSGTSAQLILNELDASSEAAALTTGTLMDTGIVAAGAGTVQYSGFPKIVRTNTSGQIRGYISGLGDSNVTIYISTKGWIDHRGRLA